ncbi:MAG: mechanosensitive ion channel family protein [Candidatus Dojkabacteria bacterium]|nr:mechanosensitive ion channel family protein [Candidatus Dojkabacteria bacterium]MDQ7020606.1 mechanosensitive ion channel family protein [Candidatus Dojkabacteria bacterium]
MNFFKEIDINGFSLDLDYIVIPAIIIVSIWFVFFILKNIVGRKLFGNNNRFLKFVGTQIVELNFLTPLITGLYISTLVFSENRNFVTRSANSLFIIIWIWELFDIVIASINYFISDASRKSKDPTDIMMYRFIGRLVKSLLILLAFLFILSNLGYNVSSLVAGLGITGIAVALAVQTVLSDFISSASIIFDKPFRIGDIINFGEFTGQVKSIGIKSTRIQSIEGEEIIVPNSELSKTFVKNYGKADKKRVKHIIGVEYSTESTILKEIPGIMNVLLEKNTRIENATYRSNLIEFGDSSINFEVVFYAMTNSYDEMLNIQEEFLFELKTQFDKKGINFAFPTSEVIVTNK